MKKVPVLVDGGNTVWESHTILRYLVAVYGNKVWYPESPYSRSQYERWMDWSHLIFQQAFMGVFWGYYRMPPQKRDMDAVDNDLQKCFDCLNVIEATLENSECLAGPSLSLADICSGSILYRLTSQGLNVPLPKNVSAWYERLKKRPGYQKWVMSDFTELKAREDY